MKLNLQLYSSVVLVLAPLCSCWQFFTPLSAINMIHSKTTRLLSQSEYIYGDCERKNLKFYAHAHLTQLQVLGKLIVRGWLDLDRIPTCIRLRAMVFEEDKFSSASWPFQMCVPRISYCHSETRYVYYYYEWYIPYAFDGGMDWDIYFFGPDRTWY